ncbi:hypothetical protein KAW64_03550 [bacterium]|nr:hypothetical protein [bacterium]
MRTVRAVITLSIVSSFLLASCAPTTPDVCPDVVDTDVVYPRVIYPPDVIQPDVVQSEVVQPGVVPFVPSVAVVVDVAISRDELTSGDYYVLDESRGASSWMIEGATETLEARKYHVSYTVAPFVGGFLGDGDLADVATEIGRTPWPRSSPFFVSPAVDSDTAYTDALLAVLRRVASTDVRGVDPLVTYADPTVLAQPDWSLLYERLGTDYVLVAVAEGVSVSGGQETGDACLSSCFSMAFSALISVICSSVTGVDVEPDFDSCVDMDVETQSTLRSVVQMFDTRTGYVVWARTMTHSHINPLSRSFYVTEWAPSQLGGIWYPTRPRR